MELLRVEDLSFTYPGYEEVYGGKNAARKPVRALSDISFSIDRGAMLCVCGPTGSGKSTLLKLLKKELAPNGTRSGSIYLCGKNIEAMTERESAAKVGFVMQRPEQQIVTDKVWHELAFGPENMGIPNARIRMRVAEIADYFGIGNWFDRKTDELSGGQKQLLNLAAVMVMQPELLILDEPTAQLDPIAASDFIATVRKLNRELALTVIIAEHRLEEVIPACDRLLVLDEGRVRAFGETRKSIAEIAGEERLFTAMPAAVKVYSMLEEKKDGKVPLDVCEGRRFLERYTQEVLSEERDGCAKDESAQGGSAQDGSAQDGSVQDGRDTPGKCSVMTEGIRDAAGEGQSTRDIAEGRQNIRDTEKVRRDIRDDKSFGHGECALEFRDVYLRYTRDGEDVLKGMNLMVRRGEILCILGGNGAGKSTAAAAAAGLLKPYSGYIRVFGRKLKEYRGQELYRNCVAMLPQDVQTVFTEDSYEGRHPYDLSGGEQQLAALNLVLAADPKLLILDEPTKGVDVYAAGELKVRLRKLAGEGMTIVIVTHDVEFAAETADRCALLFDGDITSCAETHEFFAGNYFYTTAANRMTRGLCEGVITAEEAADAVRKHRQLTDRST